MCRNTEDIRFIPSLTLGLVIQHLTTTSWGLLIFTVPILPSRLYQGPCHGCYRQGAESPRSRKRWPRAIFDGVHVCTSLLVWFRAHRRNSQHPRQSCFCLLGLPCCRPVPTLDNTTTCRSDRWRLWVCEVRSDSTWPTRHQVLDERFTHQHIALVSHLFIMFDGAVGRSPFWEVSRRRHS